MNIFIAYTLKDGVLTVNDFIKVKKLLDEHDLFIHFFRKEIDSHPKIQKKIERSDLLILIKTPASFESIWVRDELKMASQRNIPIYFIEIEDLRSEIKN